MAKKKVTKKVSDAKKVGLGIGLTAAAVSAAGAYFLYGSKKSGQNRKKVKSWALKAKGEILEALEKAETITEEEYRDLVESATGAYGTIKSATSGEVRDFKREMSDHWDKLQRSKAIRKITTPIKTQVRKAVKKVAKKTPKKAVKKVAKKTPKKTTKKKIAKKATRKAAKRK